MTEIKGIADLQKLQEDLEARTMTQNEDSGGWRAAFQSARLKASTQPKPQKLEQCTLPGVPEVVPLTPGTTAPLSNIIARSSLFSPIRRGARKLHDKTEIASPNGVDIRYTGKQLDMGDQDLYLVALKMAAGHGPNQQIQINRGDVLKKLGWKSRSNAAYKWLSESFERLSTSVVFIETNKFKASFPFLGPLVFDKETEEYSFTIPNKTLELFSGNSFGYIDLARRRELFCRVDIAKWIQGYAASHADGRHTVKVMRLAEMMSLTVRNPAEFKKPLSEALTELERVGIIQSWRWNDRTKTVEWIKYSKKPVENAE